MHNTYVRQREEVANQFTWLLVDEAEVLQPILLRQSFDLSTFCARAHHNKYDTWVLAHARRLHKHLDPMGHPYRADVGGNELILKVILDTQHGEQFIVQRLL